jgi:hypothetical protein
MVAPVVIARSAAENLVAPLPGPNVMKNDSTRKPFQGKSCKLVPDITCLEKYFLTPAASAMAPSSLLRFEQIHSCAALQRAIEAVCRECGC